MAETTETSWRVGDSGFLRNAFSFVLFFTFLNILILAIRLVPGVPQPEEREGDELPRDLIQLIAAGAKGGEYDVGTVGWIQAFMYFLAGLTLLAIVGSCSGKTCLTNAFGTFPDPSRMWSGFESLPPVGFIPRENWILRRFFAFIILAVIIGLPYGISNLSVSTK